MQFWSRRNHLTRHFYVNGEWPFQGFRIKLRTLDWIVLGCICNQDSLIWVKSVGDKRLTSTCHNLDIIKLNFIGHPDLVRGKACVTAAAIDTGPQLRVDWGLVGCGVTAAAAFSIMKAVWLHFSHLPTYIARSTNLNIAHLYKTRVFAASDCWIEKPQRLLRPKGGRGGWMKASKEENMGFFSVKNSKKHNWCREYGPFVCLTAHSIFLIHVILLADFFWDSWYLNKTYRG